MRENTDLAGRTRSWRRGVMIVTLVALLFVVAFVFLSFRRNLPQSLSAPGEEAERHFLCGWPGRTCRTKLDSTVWINIPAVADESDEKREAAHETCASQSVNALARMLETRATPKAVAGGYALRVGEAYRYSLGIEDDKDEEHALDVEEMRIIYEGCLGGFRG